MGSKGSFVPDFRTTPIFTLNTHTQHTTHDTHTKMRTYQIEPKGLSLTRTVIEPNTLKTFRRRS